MKNIQFITHATDRHTYTEGAVLALEGGCRWIQLRMKDAKDAEIIAAAEVIRPLCESYQARFIIDDHVELVKRIGADGVHLGKNDMPISEARRILGDGYIIGGTANTFDDVEKHYRDGADYIGCGPFRFTTTKENLSPILGLNGYKDILSRMKLREINIPVIAIGGIRYEDVSLLMDIGIDGIAVSGSILNADNPVEEMKKWINL
jgi:thiamine-phosphate pyrophosphorylase